MKQLNWIFKTSRPRFWTYLAGPWAVGMVTASSSLNDFRNLLFWVGLLFFLWPANFFLYGINDYADGDTDKFNPKKQEYENLYKTNQNKVLWYLLGAFAILSIVFVYLFPTIESQLVFGLWVLCSAFYSLRPIRFKARLFVDSCSNILYILPGVMVFLMYQPIAKLSWPLVISAWLWSMGMHLFSALPDIEADRNADVKTTAVWLGFKRATLLTIVYYSTAAFIFAFNTNIWLGLLAFSSYSVPTLYIYFTKNPKRVFSLYKKFPYINLFSGAVLFIYVVFKHNLLIL